MTTIGWLLKFDFKIKWSPNAAGSSNGFYYFYGLDWTIGTMSVMYLYWY